MTRYPKAATIVLGAAAFAMAGNGYRQSEPAAVAMGTIAPSMVPSAEPSAPSTADSWTWEAAIARVEELRGSAGAIEVPAELRHYDDRRRFLALQMADSREEDYVLPHDQAELAEMIQRGELVGVSALGTSHILYDVGTDAREDPLAHYDVESGKDVPLFPSVEAYAAEDARLAETAEGRGPGAAQARERREFLATFYGEPARAETLYREHRAITGLARNLEGLVYDLDDPDDRTRFQVRLLSYMRPEARDVLRQVADAYQREFDRLLPVASLIRTQRYQRRLSRVNRNATTVDVPPHTTGMAFDISYKFMASDEQNFVMQEVARLEAGGGVEALRERQNCIHVYAFAGGNRPAEPLVAGFLDDVGEAHPQAAPVRKAARRSARAR